MVDHGWLTCIALLSLVTLGEERLHWHIFKKALMSVSVRCPAWPVAYVGVSLSLCLPRNCPSFVPNWTAWPPIPLGYVIKGHIPGSLSPSLSPSLSLSGLCLPELHVERCISFECLFSCVLPALRVVLPFFPGRALGKLGYPLHFTHVVNPCLETLGKWWLSSVYVLFYCCSLG